MILWRFKSLIWYYWLLGHSQLLNYFNPWRPNTDPILTNEVRDSAELPAAKWKLMSCWKAHFLTADDYNMLKRALLMLAVTTGVNSQQNKIGHFVVWQEIQPQNFNIYKTIYKKYNVSPSEKTSCSKRKIRSPEHCSVKQYETALSFKVSLSIQSSKQRDFVSLVCSGINKDNIFLFWLKSSSPTLRSPPLRWTPVSYICRLRKSLGNQHQLTQLQRVQIINAHIKAASVDKMLNH